MGSGDGMDEEQYARWNGASGRAWVEARAVLDGMLRPFTALLAEAVPQGTGARVLDVGCGTGATTVALARRLGPSGQCVGVDLSEPMLTAAEARAADDGTSRAAFLRGDAQEYPFEPAAFDAVVSRFGVMFFPDPVRAFANLRRAAKPGAPLRFVAWRGPEDNPFMTTAQRAAAPLLPDVAPYAAGAAGPFGFADGGLVRRVLTGGGWAGVAVEPVDVPCTLPESALIPYFSRFGPLGTVLPEVDEALRARVVDTVRAAFEPYVHGPRVRYTAACWLVTAHAPRAAAGA